MKSSSAVTEKNSQELPFPRLQEALILELNKVVFLQLQ
jgi:hypothetical protein